MKPVPTIVVDDVDLKLCIPIMADIYRTAGFILVVFNTTFM